MSDLATFIDDVERVLADTDDEHEITERVAERLSDLLAAGYQLPPELTQPAPDRHVTYPLYIAPDDSWSMASVVWDVGQRTPVHSHETWGVAGIYAGAEHEVRYLKPGSPSACVALTPAGEERWEPGQVTVCCTTDDDVHAVTAVGSEPTVGIHVYGANIGTIKRRSYDPATGEACWFVSGWDSPEGVEPPERALQSIPEATHVGPRIAERLGDANSDLGLGLIGVHRRWTSKDRTHDEHPLARDQMRQVVRQP